MLPWKLQKRQILPVNQDFSSVYFSLAKFQLVSCNLSLAMIWQMTFTHKLPKLCSATLKQTRRDRPVCKKKLGNYNKCEFSNFFVFQWPNMIISVLVTWMLVDCNLAVRVVLSF